MAKEKDSDSPSLGGDTPDNTTNTSQKSANDSGKRVKEGSSSED